ncbi:hypothetical protein ULMS_18210 [Patiriisocius marinistellae]|uniref:Uncharacterized protein n=1 Tax=Patiriisocius marinistellae TaxID=2494560 RepID=A0A5J4FWF2_9FLAO|nr:hypothetical protein ULMS_18210 [Patiriisocius marinistellae]
MYVFSLFIFYKGTFIGCKIITLKAYQKIKKNNSSHFCNHRITTTTIGYYFVYTGRANPYSRESYRRP